MSTVRSTCSKSGEAEPASLVVRPHPTVVMVVPGVANPIPFADWSKVTILTRGSVKSILLLSLRMAISFVCRYTKVTIVTFRNTRLIAQAYQELSLSDNKISAVATRIGPMRRISSYRIAEEKFTLSHYYRTG